MPGLAVQVADARDKAKAQRVSMDSLGSIFGRCPDPNTLRFDLFGLSMALEELKVATAVTAERVQEHSPIARHGVEELIADHVIILRIIPENEKCRSTIQFLELRGTGNQKGGHARG
jgi:circadian clock protein KaiC